MVEIDFDAVIKVLMDCSKLVRATRKLLVAVGVVFPHMSELDCALRDRAKEIREYQEARALDEDRPLVSG